jgi:hypothetical protein
MASRIIIREKNKVTINRFEPTPSLIATEADRDDTRAAWLEGIPPVRQTMVSNSSRPLLFLPPSSMIAVLNSWASKKLDTEDKKMGFSRNALSGSARMDIAKDIT